MLEKVLICFGVEPAFDIQPVFSGDCVIYDYYLLHINIYRRMGV